MLRPWKIEIYIDYNATKAVYLQIADAIITDIQLGRLKSGEALPGSRTLAQRLNVNRNTVVEALNVLLNEEWIISKERKGTFVAENLPTHHKEKHADHAILADKYVNNVTRINFDDGYPDSKIAPVAELAMAYRQIFNRNARWQMMGYGSEFGDPEFIEALVQMLNHQRGMKISKEALCISRGSQMAMYLVSQCLFKNGDYVMVEDPGYKPAWKVFEHAGATLLPVRVDREGLIISDVVTHLQNNNKIKAIYITPHHQYPTTVTLSLQRRTELIKLSNEYNFTIIEDDYDNEFHYGYRPLLPLSSFPELNNYIYIGTMSKVVAPALRIGYLVSSDISLIQKVGALRKIIDVQGDGIMEKAVLQLISDGTLKRHIKKATNHYKNKRDRMAALLKKHLYRKVTYEIPDGGLAFWLIPNNEVNWDKISQTLLALGIKFITPDNYSFTQTANGLRIGFGSPTEKEFEEGIKELGKVITASTDYPSA